MTIVDKWKRRCYNVDVGLLTPPQRRIDMNQRKAIERMTLKEQVLELLDREKGRFLSGQALAQQLAVSRAAVWKAIRLLQEEGFQIDAQTNRGYRLNEKTDSVHKGGVERRLTRGKGFYQVQVFPSLASTNDTAKALAGQGAPEGTVVVAETQTAGKGRMRRSFFSPDDTGVYMSVILRPKIGAEQALFITTAAAVAVAEAVEAVSGRPAGIKWVNDVFCGGKKICGILTEGVCGMEDGSLEYAVLGIGINALEPQNGFPEELKEIAGAVFERGTRIPDLKNRLIAAVLDRFLTFYAQVEEKTFLQAYRERSILKGRPITVLQGGSARAALAGEIDDDCRLCVRYEDGTEALLSSGEVSIRMEEKKG